MGYIINTLVNNRSNTLIRLLSVGLGMAMGIFLLVKVARDTSFDTCFNDYNHIYKVWTEDDIGNGDRYIADQGVGPLAGALAEDLPDMIESASIVAERPGIVRADGTEFEVDGVCSDPSFFNTMGVEVLKGNPQTDLMQPYTIYLSDKLATEMFGSPEEAIGKIVKASGIEDMKVVGIYRDYGDENTVKTQFVFGQPTYTAKYGAGDDGMSWHAATWWKTYIRVKQGVRPDDLDKRIMDVIKKNVPDTDTSKHSAYARPLRDTYRNIPEVKRMNRILGWLGVLILVVTSLNYVLLSISALHRRSKAIGIFKCCGAQKWEIFRMFLAETAIILAGGLAITAICWWLTKSFAADTVYASITSAVSMDRLWVALAVTVAIFVVTGIIPAVLYSRVSAIHLFQKKMGGNTAWKSALLLIESAGAGLACCLLFLVTSQYRTLTDADLGFDPDRLVMITGHDAKEKEVFLKAYQSLPYVDAASIAYGFPGWGYDGDRIRLDEEGAQGFLSKVDVWRKGYSDMMGIRFLYGREPERNGEVAVNVAFTEHYTNNPTDMIGKQIRGGWEGDPQTVVGVTDNYRFRSFYEDVPPLSIYPMGDNIWRAVITLRLAEPFERNLDLLLHEISNNYPGEKILVRNMHHELRVAYSNVSLFAVLTGVASVIIVVITLSGLIGYVSDEMERRRKEIAIRRINGASSLDLIGMFAGRISGVCGIGVAAGALLSWIFSKDWLMQFKLTVDHPAMIIILTAIGLMIIIGVTATLMARHIAVGNPALSLKSE